MALKADVDKLDINILTNFPSELNYFKSKIDKLDVDKLLSAPVDIKKISDVVSKEVVTNIKFNKLNTKVKNLENNIFDSCTLTQKMICKTDK